MEGLPATPESAYEQIKLAASYLNGIAIGLFLVGWLSLPTSILIGTAAMGSHLAAFAIPAFFMALSPYIHRRAKAILRELD